MAKPPDLDALAKQYLDLWQQQLGGVAKDQQTADIMAQTIELMKTSAAAFAAMAPRSDTRTDTQNHTQTQGNADANDPSPTSAGGPAPGVADPDLAELSGRLEQLEKRLDTLEAGTKKSRRKPASKPKKR